MTHSVKREVITKTKQQKETSKSCIKSVPLKIKKCLSTNQVLTLGWIIEKYKWDRKEEIEYTKGIIANDLGVKESTIISTLKTLVNLNYIEKTFTGKIGIPSRVKFTNKFLEQANFEIETSNPNTEEIVAEEVKVEKRNSHTNTNLIETILQELNAIRKDFDVLKKENEELKKDNELMKKAMKQLNSKMNILHYENKTVKPIPSPKENPHIKALEEAFGKDATEQANKPYISTSDETSMKPSVIASNPQNDEVYCKGDEMPTESVSQIPVIIETRNDDYDIRKQEKFVKFIDMVMARNKGKNLNADVVAEEINPICQSEYVISPTIASKPKDDKVYCQESEMPTESVSRSPETIETRNVKEPSSKKIIIMPPKTSGRTIDDFDIAMFSYDRKLFREPELQDIEFVKALIEKAERLYYTHEELDNQLKSLMEQENNNPIPIEETDGLPF